MLRFTDLIWTAKQIFHLFIFVYVCSFWQQLFEIGNWIYLLWEANIIHKFHHIQMNYVTVINKRINKNIDK